MTKYHMFKYYATFHSVQHFVNGPDYMNSICINKYLNNALIFPLGGVVDI